METDKIRENIREKRRMVSAERMRMNEIGRAYSECAHMVTACTEKTLYRHHITKAKTILCTFEIYGIPSPDFLKVIANTDLNTANDEGITTQELLDEIAELAIEMIITDGEAS